jgi:uncharacterized membrane protein YdjX (TVP38/TMEM64 family)
LHDKVGVNKTVRTIFVLLFFAYIGLIPVVRRTVYRGLYLLAVGHLGQFHDYLRSLGPWAATVSTLLMVAQSVAVPVPVTLLMVANGLVFGIWSGMLVSFVGGFIGAVLAFYLGRRLGRQVVEHVVPRPALDAADKLMARRGGWAMVIGRWVPGIPCDPLSYAAGITRMPWGKFIVLTAVGLVPANLVTACLGAESTGDFQTGYWLVGLAFAIGLWLCWRLLMRVR